MSGGGVVNDHIAVYTVMSYCIFFIFWVPTNAHNFQHYYIYAIFGFYDVALILLR